MERLFFGYGSKPEAVRELIRETAAEMASHANVDSSISWEDLQVNGRLIVNEIESQLNSATIGVFELTSMNDNVLFELGLAIGKKKRVAILLDADDRQADKAWRDFALLTTTGYSSYRNKKDLVEKLSRFVSDNGPTLWDDLTGGLDERVAASRLLYIPSLKEDEASRKLTQLIERYSKLEVSTLDLAEYGSSAPLAWYIEELHRSRVVIFHMTPNKAYLAETGNPRVSLLAGIARGMGREVLIVAEHTVRSPIDYRDLAIHYRSPSGLKSAAKTWIESLHEPRSAPVTRVREHLAEIAALRFGNHVAERDREGLDRYFVETRDYRDVLDASASIFCGKKGTGKTANMLQAAAALREDARNLVCVIKPASYELEGLLEVMRKIKTAYLGDYLIEGLWKYLIYTEIASQAVAEAESRPAGIPTGSPLAALQSYLEKEHLGSDASFSERLDRLINSMNKLLEDGIDEHSVAEARQKVNSALFTDSLKALRGKIARAITGKQRVAVLVDNLDKAWEPSADLPLLAQFLLGLLGVVSRASDEFRAEAGRNTASQVTLTVFLRSDIFAFIRTQAREPDKIQVVEIGWRDPDLLARVLEDRFLASSTEENVAAEDLWVHYFEPEVRGLTSREYLLSRVQPRPRDLVVFANAAVTRAANAKHTKISEDDILEAEKDYSRFAYEALLVEAVAFSVNLEDILIEFAGEESILGPARLSELLSIVSRSAFQQREHTKVLRQLAFIGVETSDGRFDYGSSDEDMRKADVLVKKFERAAGRSSRFEIHPAYRAHLEISDSVLGEH